MGSFRAENKDFRLIGHLCASRFPSMVYCSFMPGQITNLTGQKAILFGIHKMACYFSALDDHPYKEGSSLVANIVQSFVQSAIPTINAYVTRPPSCSFPSILLRGWEDTNTCVQYIRPWFQNNHNQPTSGFKIIITN